MYKSRRRSTAAQPSSPPEYSSSSSSSPPSSPRSNRTQSDNSPPSSPYQRQPPPPSQHQQRRQRNNRSMQSPHSPRDNRHHQHPYHNNHWQNEHTHADVEHHNRHMPTHASHPHHYAEHEYNHHHYNNPHQSHHHQHHRHHSPPPPMSYSSPPRPGYNQDPHPHPHHEYYNEPPPHHHLERQQHPVYQHHPSEQQQQYHRLSDDRYRDAQRHPAHASQELDTEDEDHHEEHIEEDDGAPTQSESDEPRDREPSDGALTEEEEPSPQNTVRRRTAHIKRKHPKHLSFQKARRTFSWSNYHPVVFTASEQCKYNNVDASAISFARILGAGKGTVDYYVRSRSITIGRWGYGSDCQIKSDAKAVSRKHAKLFWDSNLEHWMMSCLSSKNGMVVDGAPIAPFGIPVPVKSRSLVEIGDVAFFFLGATEGAFKVNDLQLLEKSIFEARSAEEQDKQYAAINSRHEDDEDEVRPDDRDPRNDHHSSRRFSGPSDLKRSRDISRIGVKTHLGNMRPEESSSDSSDSSDEQQATPDVLDDPKYRVGPQPPALKKRRGQDGGGSNKKRRKRDRYTDDDSRFDSNNYIAEWNKKEKADFMRALNAVGMDAHYDDSGNVVGFDWTRFRGVIDFPKKSDDMLEEHYRNVMADVHDLLDGEEREKKARKSGRRRGDDDDDGGSDADAEVRSKGKDYLIGLVTAQKLRVRIGILEAAKRVDTKLWDFAIVKLDATQQLSLKDLPDWWQRKFHDRDLMRGCARHGIGQWDSIWNDPELETFVSERDSCREQGEEIEWPSPQAAMKRVRELGNAMMFEMKRLAKRDAEDERERRKRARKKEKRLSRKMADDGRHRQDGHRRRSSSDHEDQLAEDQGTPLYNEEREDEAHNYDRRSMDNYGADNGESTADDSASENRNGEPIEAEEVETEDEDGDDRRDTDRRDSGDELQRGPHGGSYERGEDERDYEERYDDDDVRNERGEWNYSDEEMDGNYRRAA